jgi:hypothetical protein
VLKALFIALALLSIAAPALAQPRGPVAPADEYFGRLKMSVLGIANVIHDMHARVDSDPSRTPSIFGGLENVADAIRDWESKYPRDSWIPKDLLALEACYLAAPGDRAEALAIRIEAWLQHDYGRTAYAAKGHSLLDGRIASVPSMMAESAK